MHPIQEKYRAQIEEVVRAANRLGQIGYVTSHGGNLSMRADGDVVLITPTKVPKRDLTFDDICAIDMRGGVLYARPGRKPTGEWPFHVRILEKRPDVKGVLHAHPPVLTGFAIAGGDWMQRAFLPEPVIEVGPMVMVPYAEPLSDELAHQFDAVVGLSNGFLMENHGMLMVSGEGVWRALELTEMMESAAISIMVARLLGSTPTIPYPEVMKLENVIKIRELPMPGLKGVVNSLADVYKMD
ncbi:MAG: class II aldolase/adducin family protein [Clostridiales bacterium]|nr:class II aldolase/adducin family protein [Clostridiales bacterium]